MLASGYKHIFLGFCLIVMSLFIVSACNDTDVSSTSESSAAVSQAYNGPGSKWDFNLFEDNTFKITRRETPSAPISLIVNGKYESLSSGFLLLTVTDALGEDAPKEGDKAWALEVPGYALLLKPIDDTNDQIIPMVTAGVCPTADFAANWVMVKKSDSAAADDADRDFFGEFQYTASSQEANLPSRRALANSFQNGGFQALGSGACTEGLMTVSDGEMYLTVNGGAIVHTGVDDPTDSSFIFALTQKAITDVANLNGDYAGILFDQSSNSGEQIASVSMSCSAGSCTASVVTDVVSGATSAETVTLTLNGTPDALATGIITGTINSGGSGNLACMADINVLGSGKKMVSCVGQSPGDNTKMFNVIFASK